MPARNPEAVRQRAIEGARQRTGQPVTPSLDPSLWRSTTASSPPGPAPAKSSPPGCGVPRLPQPAVRGRAGRHRRAPPAHQAVSAADQWEGGAVQPDPAGGVGLSAAVSLQRRPRPRLAALGPPVQHAPRPHRSRGPATSQPRQQPPLAITPSHRCQRRCQTLTAWADTPSWRATSAWCRRRTTRLRAAVGPGAAGVLVVSQGGKGRSACTGSPRADQPSSNPTPKFLYNLPCHGMEDLGFLEA